MGAGRPDTVPVAASICRHAGANTTVRVPWQEGDEGEGIRCLRTCSGESMQQNAHPVKQAECQSRSNKKAHPVKQTCKSFCSVR